MGGDLGPSEIVEAVKLVVGEDVAPIILVGDEAVLNPLLDLAGLAGNSRVKVVHASEVITMEDKPLQGLKRKKDSSMVRALDLAKAGEAAVVVSCGNTGALMAGGTIKLRPMPGVERPALAAVIPRQEGFFILIDAGANPDATPVQLMHNAVLGANYARVLLGAEAPRVGLLTIGTEEGKGNAVITETHELLKRLEGIIHYVGPIEGFQVFENHVDVVVCDGFVGNTLAKTWESLARFIKGMIREELGRNPLRQAGGLLAKGAFDALKGRLNTDRYGAAPLLGLRGNVFKAHGSSNRHGIAAAIRGADKVIRMDLYQHTSDDLARANNLLAPPVAAP
jgi:glycerol-3-phosphate acyltransferase PlsX